MRLLWLLLLLFASLPQDVFAIDPGRVQGSLQVNDKAIALTQAYAHLHDNAEGLLDHPKELRLLLVDREVPQEALAGISLLPVEQMAREGRVQGLLLRLDPSDHKRLFVTLLYPPTEPGQTLLTQTVSSTGRKPPIELKIGSFNRVGGAVEHHEDCQSETMGMPKIELFTPLQCTVVPRDARHRSSGGSERAKQFSHASAPEEGLGFGERGFCLGSTAFHRRSQPSDLGLTGPGWPGSRIFRKTGGC